VKDYLRYAIWLGLAGTAEANRRHFGLATTWVPHLLGNSVALLLPELCRIADHLFQLDVRLDADQHPTAAALYACVKQLVLENMDYVDYVAPAALAYIVSHPRFNIYRGDWGELKLAGFGLDSIPHSTTAYAISELIYDSIEALERNTTAEIPLRPYVAWAAAHKTLVAGTIMAVLTLAYELGEYLIRQSELKARNYDESQINMMWSFRNTVYDVLSNGVGWAMATLRR
jgi:hypothetical protein